jgi:hypothetical protein
MKFFCILLATLCAATGYGQTIKTLGFNTTNNTVVGPTNGNALVFTNTLTFVGDGSVVDIIAEESRALVDQDDSSPAMSYDSAGSGWTVTAGGGFRTAIGLGTTNDVTFNSLAVSNAALTRTNLGLPLAALTNTSNVTTMRALAGSTNTNQPYSGTIEYLDHGNLTWVMVVSNGIIIDNYEQ